MERPDYWDGDIPWASAKDMKVEFIYDTADHVSTLALDEWGMSVIQPPAVLLVVRGMILAHSLPVAVSRVALTINQDMKALRPRPNCSPEFLMRWFQGVKHGVAALIEPSAHGTRCLRFDLLKQMRCFLPPRGEQDRICSQITSETAKLQEVTRATGQAIQKLREYRAALITAAVTGQLDLRKHEKQMEALA
jgi:type I restriction enzyme S subunit